MPDDFDPRLAALQYAASVEAHGREGGIEPAAGDALHALVCGLLYVGDQVRALSDVTDEPDRVTFGDLLERLTDIAAAAVPEPMAKRVTLVSSGFATLEVDGEQHELATGDSLDVPLGIKVT